MQTNQETSSAHDQKTHTTASLRPKDAIVPVDRIWGFEIPESKLEDIPMEDICYERRNEVYHHNEMRRPGKPGVYVYTSSLHEDESNPIIVMDNDQVLYLKSASAHLKKDQIGFEKFTPENEAAQKKRLSDAIKPERLQMLQAFDHQRDVDFYDDPDLLCFFPKRVWEYVRDGVESVRPVQSTHRKRKEHTPMTSPVQASSSSASFQIPFAPEEERVIFENIFTHTSTRGLSFFNADCFKMVEQKSKQNVSTALDTTEIDIEKRPSKVART